MKLGFAFQRHVRFYTALWCGLVAFAIAWALKLPASAVRVHYDVDVGGSYGVKRGIKHAVLVGYLSKRLGFPVRLIEDRLENMRGGDMHGPERLFDVEVAYDQVVAQIRAQFSLGYTSLNTAMDGRWRKVDVRLTRPDLKGARIQSRKGYFALFKEGKQDRRLAVRGYGCARRPCLPSTTDLPLSVTSRYAAIKSAPSLNSLRD